MDINDGGRCSKLFFFSFPVTQSMSNQPQKFHKQEFKHKSWSLLFYEYMVNGLSKKWNILTPESVVHYSDLLNLTLDYLPPDVRETAEVIPTRVLKVLRKKLMKFFFICIKGHHPIF